MKTIIEKQISTTGKYLLGKDKYGILYWLSPASWDCGWYWGFGYVSTKDSHQHIDSSFMGKIQVYNPDKNVGDYTEYIHNIFNCPTLTEVTFSEGEGWVLSELFKTFYILKESAEMWYRGGAHITSNPLKTVLKRENEEKYTNTVLLPLVFEEIYKILKPKS